MRTQVVRVSGIPNLGALACFVLSVLSRKSLPEELIEFSAPGSKPLVLVLKDEDSLDEAQDAIAALCPIFFPDSFPAAAVFGSDPQIRAASLEKLHSGAPLVLATEEGLAADSPDPGEYASSRLVLRPGSGLARSELLSRLESIGYGRVDFVESPGEFAVRGAVVDFFPFEPPRPVRVLFEADAIATLKPFDPSTQIAAAEFLQEAVVVPLRCGVSKEPVGARMGAGAFWILDAGVEVPSGAVRAAALSPGGADAVDFGAVAGIGSVRGIDAVAESFSRWSQDGLRVVLYALNDGEAERIEELLDGRVPSGTVEYRIGPLRHGFVHARTKTAVASSAELFGRFYRRPKILKPVIDGGVRVRWRELKRGDFVVHEDFGIARYHGLETVTVGGGRRAEAEGKSSGVFDCLKLEFRGGDRLYVPMSDFKKVQKYGASEGRHVRLSSLDTKAWEDVKNRVREGVRELAENLLKAHAERKARPGFAFPPDSHIENEFAESFPFEETPDQRKAIEDVKRDMMEPHPMDRLVVGDVGFGKTEVAMRAALKCACGHRQTALLAPTTVLAEQHARTFRERFAEYPVSVELLSRFQSRAEQKEILKGLASGKIDIVVGTHRLLSPDVRFASLGLVVVDEEHRFGVKHKEGVKTLRAQVDCLSLSATPIPRSLHQGLAGLREVSFIQSAPTGRLPISTELRPFDEKHVKAAIEAELSRGGQVFYVHNSVKTLSEAAARIRKMIPGVRVAEAHGKMKGEELEAAMWDFSQGKFDVLTASTIIESGLDIPSANTLLIENAQNFGLSQLYQLRGRIGRERRSAYCTLYYPGSEREYKSLSEEARKRLEAMREFASLGSGLALAMRDLEIRGTGDLLGARQHGFVNAVGIEFYSELLDEEVRRLQGERKKREVQHAHVDVEIPAFIPEDCLPGDFERIRFYRRVLNAADDEGIESLERELIGLCGPLPEPAANLFRVLRLRGRATSLGVSSVVQRGEKVEVRFRREAAVPVEAVLRWIGIYKDAIEFIRSPEGDGLKVSLSRKDPVAWIIDFLAGLPYPEGPETGKSATINA